MSDRIAVMSQGHILQVGTPTEIYERPTARFVADFIGESNFLEGTLAGVSGEVGTVRLPGGAQVQGRAQPGLAAGAAVALSIRPEKIQISDHPLESSTNTFPVHVSSIAYVGSDTRIRVLLPHNLQLDIWEPNNRSTLDKEAYYAPGDTRGSRGSPPTRWCWGIRGFRISDFGLTEANSAL